MQQSVDTCLTGWGVSCGAEVQVKPDCSVQVEEGTLVLPSGTVVHTEGIRFRYYVRPEAADPEVRKAVLAFLGLDRLDERYPEYMELAGENHPSASVDPLKQQHPEDTPEHNLLMNRIMAVWARPRPEGPPRLTFLLLARDAVARARKIKPAAGDQQSGLFSRPITRKEIDAPTIEEFLRPQLKLRPLFIPRVGYKKLALVDAAAGLEESNLQHPFTTVSAFRDLFFEYKELIDEHLPILQKALSRLHQEFGSLLSHKGDVYLEKYRKVLAAKVHRFYEQGEHLYYIQYLYDWLSDLDGAFNELIDALDGYLPGCPCPSGRSQDAGRPDIVLLGPVLGGKSTYTPLMFRDLAQGAADDEEIRRVRMLHWRLLMMIWTFDLPFLRLEKVLRKYEGQDGIEEVLDATDYWEAVNAALPEAPDGERNHLPVKLTPTRGPWEPLGMQAIPYYYPVDGNSLYSLHQFWSFPATRQRATDRLLSYHAHEGDPSRPATDVWNDSYSERREVILPLAFSLLRYPYLKPEGHIGKKITIPAAAAGQFFLQSFPLREYLNKYNLLVEVIAIGIGQDAVVPLHMLNGLERRPVLEQGETLVLLYVASDNEQIELAECNRDETPEIALHTVVADFVLPYRWSCCPADGLNALTLTSQPPR
ncbi:MAG TPA: hypothetical protein VHK69_12635 [Chitinophagaceae bacterium]|jgi:hypothetical protein|nr:hypothetical protein [Chitinophagaceae bacterium]